MRVCRPKAGFTLIELLVVLAIVAVLTSILFPVFVQAREASRRTSCSSNLRQLGHAFSLYVSDNDDCWPGIWTGKWNYHGGAQLNWPAALAPLVRSYQVYRCPSDIVDRVAVSYIGNLWLHNRGEAAIDRPTECVVLMDGYTGEGPEYDPYDDVHFVNGIPMRECSISGLNADYTIWNMASRVTRPDKGLPRHQGRNQVLFADGHVGRTLPLKAWGQPGALEALEAALPYSRYVEQTGGSWQNR
jgi:prepilin-type N-terminal cleavage/methylation domain-containing protein/prepilin-type processing-associated H-X9-DG protein